MSGYTRGAENALEKLGLDASGRLPPDVRAFQRKIRDLAEPGVFNRFESLFTPKDTSKSTDPATAQAAIDAERTKLRKRYNVTPRLTGSMPLKLNIPGDVDLDFFINAQSPEKFQRLVKRLETSEYTPSAYNKPGAMYHVFQRKADGPKDFPVDLAIAYGAPAAAYAANLKQKQLLSERVPDSLRQQLIEKKRVLRNTPFDYKSKRYKAFKRDLEAALGGIRLNRSQFQPEKTAEIIDLNDPAQLETFRQFANRKDIYGHRTHNLDAVLESGHLSSAIDALHSGKLKSYEAGSEQGTHAPMPYTDLSPEHLALLEKAILTPTPNTSAYDEIAKATTTTPDVVKANFIRQRYGKIKGFTQAQPDPEGFRLSNLAIPKLSPNIFVTQGGVMDTPSYGDAALLFKSHSAKPSPYMNLVTDERVIGPKSPFDPRRAPIGHGYTLLPQAQIGNYEKKFPTMKYVAQESLPEDLRSQLFKPVHSVKETWERWLPAAMSGDLSVRETR